MASGIINKVKDALHSDSHKHEGGSTEGTHGLHSSQVAKTADPRVDSDMGNTGYTDTGAARRAGHGEYGSTTHPAVTEGGPIPAPGMAGSDYGTGRLEGKSALHSGAGEFTTVGTGGFKGRGATVGVPGAGSGVTGVTSAHGAPGGSIYGSNVADSTAPRVNLDRDGEAAMPAGPHKSDLMNKADPRVDSDLDGSRTVGGDRTFQ